MLQAIRDRAQGWLAWVIVILISIPFALWGVNEYIGPDPDPSVITVGEREIGQREFRQAYFDHRRRLQEIMGSDFRPELIDEAQLREQVVKNLVENEITMAAALDQGYRVSDAQLASVIQAQPSFQRDGRFDRVLFEQYLRTQGQSAETFALRLRAALMRGQLEAGLAGTEFVTSATIRRLHELRRQKRAVEYAVVPTARYAEQQVSDTEIEAYYRDNIASFLTPERVRLSYIDLRLEDLAEQIAVGDEDLRQRYEERKAQFGTPEDRKVSHILIPVEDSLDAAQDAAAKARIEELRARIGGSEDFAAVARAASGDPGSAQDGGDLGFIGRGIMDPEFERVAYELPLGQVSEPVRTAFGYHLLQVTEITEAEVQPFEARVEELRRELQRERAESQFFALAEQLATLTFEAPDTLSVAAEALDLPIQSSDWVERAGGSGIGAHAAVVNAAFSDDVLAGGNNSEPLELGGDRLVVVRVAERREATQRSLEEVRGEIEQRLRADAARNRAAEAGTEMLRRVRGGESLKAVAAAEGLQVKAPGFITRESAEIPPAVLRQAFRLGRPGPGATVADGVVLANGDFAVMELLGVEEGAAPITAEEQQSLRNAIIQARAQDAVAGSTEGLRTRAKVSINPENY